MAKQYVKMETKYHAGITEEQMETEAQMSRDNGNKDVSYTGSQKDGWILIYYIEKI
ncbi:hypothetical protein ACFSM5_05520 [Lacibacterium aquatile]|uniref:Uncharacterized protein n=1 Tax=Lacibacterium aquatile TaxID=1168082 RepID=A0ABW5DN32_9PROT